jgi:hypothetical protein
MIKDEITPPHLRCNMGFCVAVYELKDGNLLVVGKKPADPISQEIASRVGPDEEAVVISPEYFNKLLPQPTTST